MSVMETILVPKRKRAAGRTTGHEPGAPVARR